MAKFAKYAAALLPAAIYFGQLVLTGGKLDWKTSLFAAWATLAHFFPQPQKP